MTYIPVVTYVPVVLVEVARLHLNPVPIPLVRPETTINRWKFMVRYPVCESSALVAIRSMWNADSGSAVLMASPRGHSRHAAFHKPKLTLWCVVAAARQHSTQRQSTPTRWSVVLGSLSRLCAGHGGGYRRSAAVAASHPYFVSLAVVGVLDVEGACVRIVTEFGVSYICGAVAVGTVVVTHLVCCDVGAAVRQC